MKLSLIHILKRSLSFYKTGVLYQFIIIILLTAVITGSLMTGNSVRSSLKSSSTERLGNVGIMISSGIRYFDPSLKERMIRKTGVKCAGILEINGYCQNFSSGQTVFSVKIFATDKDFFSFQGNNGTNINHGEAAVNEKLASYLGLKQGDDLIIRFKGISNIPANAPFATEQEASGSVVLKVGSILKSGQSASFSLGISQITPLNVFVNRSDLTDNNGDVPKINRLLLENKNDISESDVYRNLSEILKPEDFGLNLRFISKTGEFELISDRIFIDQLIIEEIKKIIPSSSPVLTYLGNSFISGTKATPYSFISALPPSLYPGIPGGNGIIINNWLAADLGVNEGDTIKIIWYFPDPSNRLIEKSNNFIVSQIVELEGIWSDSLLMPDFPGIAGSKSCSEWDAGISIKLDRIRQKDEEYWNKYRGTPKAFIGYEKGKELWGNNFGPATSIRFPANISEDEIKSKLTGSVDPLKTGFFISDLPFESKKAADESVDFSTLFLSLGFFIILSAVILLILVVSTFFESKKEQITTLFSLGFSNNWIERLLFYESGIIAITGTITGVFAGGLFNFLVIKALNSVWQGAVQTNTLSTHFNAMPLFSGFIITITIILVILKIKSKMFLNSLSKPETGVFKRPSQKMGFLFFIFAISLTVIILTLSFLFSDYSTLLSFSGGIMMFVSLVLLSLYFYLRRPKNVMFDFRKRSSLSGLYYSFKPLQAIVPIIFIAAGLFAVIITGVNKLNISESMLRPSGGTGGFALWGEAAVPVKANLNGEAGRREFGLDEDELKELSFIQARKSSGDDASCLNLNHVASPPLLGIDPSEFIRKGSFSFAGKIKNLNSANLWTLLSYPPSNNTIYGIADQTVLQWGLKIKSGDTLILRSENGQTINIIIAAGLKPSVFQGYVIIGSENFGKFFPSVSGSQVFLVDGKPGLSDLYKNVLTERLSNYGIHFEPAGERLASFFVVTNTYLSVFSILGGIGMILGIIGLGFILIRNFNQRKGEFGLMMATGFSINDIRKIIFGEQARILLTGIIIGLISALISTLPSIISGTEIPWINIMVMILLILITGLITLAISIKTITENTLIANIRNE